jgi:hypothetical protein
VALALLIIEFAVEICRGRLDQELPGLGDPGRVPAELKTLSSFLEAALSPQDVADTIDVVPQQVRLPFSKVGGSVFLCFRALPRSGSCMRNSSLGIPLLRREPLGVRVLA